MGLEHRNCPPMRGLRIDTIEDRLHQRENEACEGHATKIDSTDDDRAGQYRHLKVLVPILPESKAAAECAPKMRRGVSCSRISRSGPRSTRSPNDTDSRPRGSPRRRGSIRPRSIPPNVTGRT